MPRGKRQPGKDAAPSSPGPAAVMGKKSKRGRPTTSVPSTPVKGTKNRAPKPAISTIPEPEPILAVVRSTLPLEDLPKWLPQKWISAVKASKNEMEWKAKVRWLVAMIFFRCRFMDTAFMRATLQILEPTNNQVINATGADTLIWFRDLTQELQERIWFAHETISEAFLKHTSAGKEYIQAYCRQTENHRPRPKMMPADVASVLSLSTSDVRGLWTAIEFTANRGHWESTSTLSKVPAEALRRASYQLIAKVIGHWVRGGKPELNSELSLSTTSTLKDFQTSTDLNDPPDWPKLPPQSERPCSTKSWEEFADTYPLPQDNPLFVSLIQRIKSLDPQVAAGVVISTPQRSSNKQRGNLATSSTSSSRSSSPSTSRYSSDLDDESSDDSGTPVSTRTSYPALPSQPQPENISGESEPPSQSHSFLLIPDPRPEANKATSDSDSEPVDFTPKKPTVNFQFAQPATSSMSFSSSMPKGDSRFSATPTDVQKLNITPGRTPSFRLDNDQPPELDGHDLPTSTMEIVDLVAEDNVTKRQQLAQELIDEGMHDAWYIDNQSAHVASLSAVGKAEYSMYCLAREISRYDRVIFALSELKAHDEQRIKQLEESRQRAITRQELVDRLDREMRETNKKYKHLKAAERVREMEAYGIPHAVYGPSTPGSQTQSSNIPRNPSSAQSSFRECQSSPLYSNSSTISGGPVFQNQSQDLHGPVAGSLKRKADVHEGEKSERQKRKRERKLRKEQEKLILQSQSGDGDLRIQPPPPIVASTGGNNDQAFVKPPEDPMSPRSAVVPSNYQPLAQSPEMVPGGSANQAQTGEIAAQQIGETDPGRAVNPDSYHAAFSPRPHSVTVPAAASNFFATETTAEGTAPRKEPQPDEHSGI